MRCGIEQVGNDDQNGDLRIVDRRNADKRRGKALFVDRGTRGGQLRSRGLAADAVARDIGVLAGTG